MSRPEFDMLNDAYDVASEASVKAGLKLESHLKSDLGSEQPLHMSLSRPNVLTTAQREGFLELFTDRLYKARIRPFVSTYPFFFFLSGNEIGAECGI